MAILMRVVAAAALAQADCYTPELPDCAVSCAGADDCAPGQVCGADAFCATPAVAGRCRSMIGGDAGLAGPHDAATMDAFVPPPDLPPTWELEVKISGRGRVVVDGVGTCDHTAANETCRFEVLPHVALQLTAVPTDDSEFDKWASDACAGHDVLCDLDLIQPTTVVHAKFRSHGG